MRELAQLTGISVRTIRLYAQRGVLPRPPFKGTATRYQRRQLLWLCAVRRLRATEKQLTLAAIRTRLQALSAIELEAFATEKPSPAIATALGLRAGIAELPVSTTPSATPSLALHAAAGAAAGVGPGLRAARWHRIELALGLELHVCDDASPSVLELSRRVRQLCAGT